MERAIAYVRVSDNRQVKDGNSLATQEKLVRDFAASRKYVLQRVFVEKGESAKTDERPVLQEMLAFAKAHRAKLDVLVIPKIDRLARNIADYLGLKLKFQRLDVRIESVGEQLMDSPVGRFTESVLASVAQFDNEIRAERSKGGMIQAVREGRWVWMAPRGYRNVRTGNRSNIEPDPNKARIVAAAFSKLAKGSLRPKEVRAWLGRKGVKLSRSQFYRMVHSKIYIGVIEAFGETVRAAEPFIPIVPESVFYRAQQSFRPSSGPRTYDRENSDFPLRGTVRCSCGKYMTGCWSSGRGKRYAYYRCMTCTRTNLPREYVEREFVRLLATYKVSTAELPKVKRYLLEQWREESAYANLQIARLSSEVLRLQDLRKAVATKNIEGVIPDDLAKDHLHALAVEIANKEIEVQEAKKAETPVEEVIDFSLDFLANLGTYWKQAMTAMKKRIQRFWFPNGVDFTVDDGFRTDNTSSFSGLGESFSALLSQVVGPMHESPNVVRSKRQKLLTDSDEWIILRRIYDEFGVCPPEDAG